MQSNKLIIASKNPGKVKEFKAMLEPLGYDISSIADIQSPLPDVVEDGDTFYANALKKAQAIADALGHAVIADDSGLSVDALDGKPGVRSARFAGEQADDQANNQKLLRELTTLGVEMQVQHLEGASAFSRARFICALVLYDPRLKEIIHVEGACEGVIISEPRGQGGFGYDPLFYVPELGKTMAELSGEEKNLISHRGTAMKQLLAKLQAR